MFDVEFVEKSEEYQNPESCFCSTVYLNVTNIETYNIDYDKFCIKWSPHRAATSYRIKLHPLDRKSGSSHCVLIHHFDLCIAIMDVQ